MAHRNSLPVVYPEELLNVGLAIDTFAFHFNVGQYAVVTVFLQCSSADP